MLAFERLGRVKRVSIHHAPRVLRRVKHAGHGEITGQHVWGPYTNSDQFTASRTSSTGVMNRMRMCWLRDSGT